jgi:hypothetical protein
MDLSEAPYAVEQLAGHRAERRSFDYVAFRTLEKAGLQSAVSTQGLSSEMVRVEWFACSSLPLRGTFGVACAGVPL